MREPWTSSASQRELLYQSAEELPFPELSVEQPPREAPYGVPASPPRGAAAPSTFDP